MSPLAPALVAALVGGIALVLGAAPFDSIAADPNTDPNTDPTAGARHRASGSQLGSSAASARASLVAEHQSAQPGSTTWIGVEIDIAKDWHVYWTNPGDAGLPTKLAVDAPAGIAVGAPRWPAPTWFVAGPIGSYGYGGRLLIALPVEVAADQPAGPHRVSIRANWLLCHDDEGCFPGGADLVINLDVAPGQPKPSRAADRFEAARAAWPRPTTDWRVELRVNGSAQAEGDWLLTLELPPKDPDSGAPERAQAFDLARHDAHFFPFESGLIEPSEPQAANVHGRRLDLQLVRSVKRQDAPGGELAGVLVLRPFDGGTELAFELRAPMRESS